MGPPPSKFQKCKCRVPKGSFRALKEGQALPSQYLRGLLSNSKELLVSSSTTTTFPQLSSLAIHLEGKGLRVEGCPVLFGNNPPSVPWVWRTRLEPHVGKASTLTHVGQGLLF